MRLGTDRAEEAGIPLLGPEGAGKLASPLQLELGQEIVFLAILQHKLPTLFFPSAVLWGGTGVSCEGLSASEQIHLGGGVQVPWCLCWWIWG